MVRIATLSHWPEVVVYWEKLKIELVLRCTMFRVSPSYQRQQRYSYFDHSPKNNLATTDSTVSPNSHSRPPCVTLIASPLTLPAHRLDLSPSFPFGPLTPLAHRVTGGGALVIRQRQASSTGRCSQLRTQQHDVPLLAALSRSSSSTATWRVADALDACAGGSLQDSGQPWRLR